MTSCPCEPRTMSSAMILIMMQARTRREPTKGDVRASESHQSNAGGPGVPDMFIPWSSTGSRGRGACGVGWGERDEFYGL